MCGLPPAILHSMHLDELISRIRWTIVTSSHVCCIVVYRFIKGPSWPSQISRFIPNPVTKESINLTFCPLLWWQISSPAFCGDLSRPLLLFLSAHLSPSDPPFYSSHPALNCSPACVVSSSRHWASWWFSLRLFHPKTSETKVSSFTYGCLCSPWPQCQRPGWRSQVSQTWCCLEGWGLGHELALSFARECSGKWVYDLGERKEFWHFLGEQ